MNPSAAPSTSNYVRDTVRYAHRPGQRCYKNTIRQFGG